MMGYYALVDLNSLVVSVGACPEDMTIYQAVGTNFSVYQLDQARYEIVRSDPKRFYGNSGQILDRVIMPISVSKSEIVANGEDVTVISGIPIGAHVTITGAVTYNGVMTESEIHLSSSTTGKVTLKFQFNPTYLPHMVQINAT